MVLRTDASLARTFPQNDSVTINIHQTPRSSVCDDCEVSNLTSSTTAGLPAAAPHQEPPEHLLCHLLLDRCHIHESDCCARDPPQTDPSALAGKHPTVSKSLVKPDRAMVVSELTASAVARGPIPIEGGVGGGGPPSQLPPLQNRASSSKSPFARSAVSSPVKWQLLDAESVERAKRENKLIFLHVGYKACHCESSLSIHILRAQYL